MRAAAAPGEVAPTEASPPLLSRSSNLLELVEWCVAYRTADGIQRTVLDRIDLAIRPGEIVGLVGQSGVGKSTLAFSLLDLLPIEGRVIAGELYWRGSQVDGETGRRRLRGDQIGLVLQTPRESLNPVETIGRQITALLRHHRGFRGKLAIAEARELLRLVGLPVPDRCLAAYPHELSRGMCQRAMLAMVLACRPALLIADEPTSALDITSQARVLRLLRRVRDALGISILIISHDLAVVSELCEAVMVMQGGAIVEQGATVDVFSRPAHQYTVELLAAASR